VSLRLFVALDLPDAARAALAALEPDPEIWRRVPPEALHVTLAFLGARPAGDVETIRPIIAAEAGPAPALAFGPIRVLNRRVLTVALEGDLAPLQGRVADALTIAGVYAPERRGFRPHVTVARVRGRARPARMDLELPPLTFHGAAVTLYASHLLRDGARYEVLATASLAAP
jgi:RNA 2',3'-cyclic 3'-phosphodiesterase